MSIFSSWIGYDNGRIGANIALIGLGLAAGLHIAGWLPDNIYQGVLTVSSLLGIASNKNPQ